MSLSEIYRALGRERFDELLGSISIGALRTYKAYETVKIRARLSKLNRQRLRKAAPKLWARIEADEDDLARDLAQAILVSHLDFVVEALDFLTIPHDGIGFFDKDEDHSEKLKSGWRKKLLKKFRGKYPEALILFYTNHLDWELAEPEEVFLG